MASVHERNGKWQVKYRDPSGAQRSRTFSQKRDATKFAGQVEVQKERGEWRDPALGRTTFAAVAETWFAEKSHLRATTRSTYESTLSKHLLPEFGSMQVARITPASVRSWVGRARAEGIGPSALHLAYKLLDQVLAMAVEDHLIPSSPVPQKERPRAPEATERRFLTVDEVDLLASVIEPRYELLVLTAAWTGLRFSELAGLRVDRLDLMRRTIEVRDQLVEVRGGLQTVPPKSKAGRRKVGVPKLLVPRLEAHLGAWSGEYVFPMENGPLRKSAFHRKPWPAAVAAAGLDGLTFHALRHTHASLSIKAGASVLALSRRLGHARPSLTLDCYSHLFPGDDTAVTDSLDRLYEAAI